MKKDLIHCIAHCEECDWKEEYFLKAREAGRKHNKKTGHYVVVEEGTCIHYGENPYERLKSNSDGSD